MFVLALDTTTRLGSVALLQGERLLDELVGDPALTHAERLPLDVSRLLERHGLSIRQIDVFAVAAGPGSFTGLRVGIATVQGLAVANRRLVVPVSALDALAYLGAEVSGAPADPAHGDDELIAVWMDAQRREVFSALYRRAPPGGGGLSAAGLDELALVDAPASESPRVTLAGWADHLAGHPTLFVGDGADLYREEIEAQCGTAARILGARPALAGVVGRIAARRAVLGRAVPPHAIRPVYVRRPDAELAQERSRARTAGGH